MSSYPSITWNNSSDNNNDDDDISDAITSLQLGKPCDNEALIVKRKVEYFVETQDGDDAAKWNIKNLKPHEKSDPFKKDKNLIGEVVYGRGGKPVGEFAFKDPENLKCHAGKCNPDTQHARLHKEVFGKCPEEEKDLVATGFSYQTGKGLVFNSNTFNDNSKPYIDNDRYAKTKTRVAGNDAQEMIKSCTDEWKSQNCPKNWSFSPQKKKNSKK